VLAIRSTESFTEPVVNFLVDLHWSKGELVRQYTLLLDPADFAARNRAPESLRAADGASEPGVSRRTRSAPGGDSHRRDENANVGAAIRPAEGRI